MKEENKSKEMSNKTTERKGAATPTAKFPQQAEVSGMADIPAPTQEQGAYPSHDVYDISGMHGLKLMKPFFPEDMPIMEENGYNYPMPGTYQMPESYGMPHYYQVPQMYMGPMICCPVLKQLQCPIMMNGYGMINMGGMGIPRW